MLEKQGLKIFEKKTLSEMCWKTTVRPWKKTLKFHHFLQYVFQKEQGTRIFQYCTCPAGPVTIFTPALPANTHTCPLIAYAIKNIRE